MERKVSRKGNGKMEGREEKKEKEGEWIRSERKGGRENMERRKMEVNIQKEGRIDEYKERNKREK